MPFQSDRCRMDILGNLVLRNRMTPVYVQRLALQSSTTHTYSVGPQTRLRKVEFR